MFRGEADWGSGSPGASALIGLKSGGEKLQGRWLCGRSVGSPENLQSAALTDSPETLMTQSGASRSPRKGTEGISVSL